MKSDLKIQKTTDYGLFLMHERNRPVRESVRYKRLRTSMEKYGFLPYPIHCVPNGGSRIKIIDGHRRFTVATELGLPVYYILSDREMDANLEPSDVSCAQEAWNPTDYINTHKEKHPDIAELDDFCKRHRLSISIASVLLSGLTSSGGNSNIRHDIESGQFKIRERKYAEVIAMTCNELSKINKCAMTRFFISALSKCIRVKDFNVSVFVEKARKAPSLFTKQGGIQEYLATIESVYNYRSRSPIPLAFLANQETKEETSHHKK